MRGRRQEEQGVDGLARTPRRLEPEARREQIIEAAVCYFAEVGFGGTTRDLARRAGITQALLYRYFASKDELVEAVYERVFIGRMKPHWTTELCDRAVPLEHRIIRFYRDYATIFTYEWMRIFMWAGLAGEKLNQRYLTRVASQLLEPLRQEIAAEGRYRLPDAEELWGLHGGVVYIAIRRHIYRLPTPADDGPVVERNVRLFLAGLRIAAPERPSGAAATSSRAARPSAARSARAPSRR
jgi:AcrR family transcriptional regulator